MLLTEEKENNYLREENGESGQKRPDLMTFASPLIFMFLHALFLNLAAMAVVIVYLFRSDLPFELISNSQSLELLFFESQAQNWASVLLGLVMIPIYLSYLFYRRRKYVSIFLTEKAPGRYWLTGVAGIMGSLGLSMLWIGFLIQLGDSFPWISEQYESYIQAAQNLQNPQGYFWLEILAVVVMIPIAEELLFRGILQGELRRVAPAWLAIAITVLIFSFFHILPFQIAFVIIPGLVLSVVYELTRNILIPILMHMAYNFFGGGIFSRLIGLPEDDMTLFLVEMAFILIGLVMIVRLIRERKSLKAKV